MEFLAWQPYNTSVVKLLAQQRYCTPLRGPFNWIKTGSRIDWIQNDDGKVPAPKGSRQGWQIDLPVWARSMSDTPALPLRGKQLMLLRRGQIFGCPHAMTRPNILASNTSAFGTLQNHVFVFPSWSLTLGTVWTRYPMNGEYQICQLP